MRLPPMTDAQRDQFRQAARDLMAANPGRWPIAEGLVRQVSEGKTPAQAVASLRRPWWRRLLGRRP